MQTDSQLSLPSQYFKNHKLKSKTNGNWMIPVTYVPSIHPSVKTVQSFRSCMRH